MKIIRAYKTELDVNNVQKTFFNKSVGTARWAYNWGLSKKIAAYEAGQKAPSARDLHKELNKLKQQDKSEGGVPWMYEVSKYAAQNALLNLDQAYANFFRRVKDPKIKEKGFPKFKSKKNPEKSFTVGETIRVFEREIQLPKIGKVKLKESNYLPKENVKILNATISNRANRWFVSLCVEEDVILDKGTEILGVDVGIKTLATLSDGTEFSNPKALKKARKRLNLLQRNVDRKVKGSNNRKKAVDILAIQHYRISNVRKDSIQKATTAIAKRSGLVGIETLNVSGMLQNHKLAGAVADASMSEFLRCLKYKMSWHDAKIVEVDRWFPSSKRCSVCGWINHDLKLSDREWICEKCGTKHQRDVNAAVNIKEEALRIVELELKDLEMAASSAVGSHACGGIEDPPQPEKQEPDLSYCIRT